MAKRRRKANTKTKKRRTDAAGRTAKANKATAAARLEEVLDMVAKGRTSAEIVRYGAENWKLKRRGVEKYLTKAYDIFHNELSKQYPKKVAALVARQEAIYEHAMSPVPKFHQGVPLYFVSEDGQRRIVVERDLGTARQIVMDQGKLLGLFSERFEFDFGEHADPYPDVPVKNLMEKARVFE